MTTKTWQAPIVFELDEAKPVAKEKKPVSQSVKTAEKANMKPVAFTEKFEKPTTASAKAPTQRQIQHPAQHPVQEKIKAVDNTQTEDFARIDDEPVHIPETERNLPEALERFFDKLDSLPLPEVLSSRINREQAQQFSPLRWLFASLAALLMLMLVVDTWRFLATQFNGSLFLGLVFSLLVLTITATAGWLAWSAWTEIRRLRTVSTLQEEGETLLENDAYGHATPYLNKVAHFYEQRADVKPGIDRFYIVANDHHTDTEACQLFSQQVLKDLDEQAYRIVLKRSNETALMVMISPIASISTILTLWRNMQMIRDVATLYGGRPGFFASFPLLGAVVQNLIYADVSEIMADSVGEIFGGGVLSVVSGQMAQGLGSSLMTARVGLFAMHACRPLPFQSKEKPSLKNIRHEVLRSLKKAITGDKTSRFKKAVI
ncbi:TIGR01620 family protein [Candidatus Venteria ishoeyi]|uniref:TIGR01620 family protein n=1 Tax=Candidatus Venteria ishoeyi TaxID=1899563 RepID=UPI0025A587D3|nr:TIGR01620 family protein [Candidatus Venteria ishoeyi]MDM8547488.1 TIGR01620 family protein [Candidatus Venteria ishoeyi]